MPANLQQLETAFMNAHNAGDTQAAGVLAAEIKRQRAGATPAASAPAPAPAAPQQDGLGAFEKIGHGMMDPINGGAQLLTRMLPQGVVDAGNKANNWLADKTGLVARLPEGGVDQQVRDDEHQYQARRAAAGESGFDGYRTIGNIVSPVNVAAAARAGSTVLGGIGAGAAMGALEPTTDENFWSTKAKQVGVGAVTGGAVPAAMRAAKVLRAGLVDPFTDAGRNKIVGRTLNTAASDKAAAMANMTSRTGATPGFMPTVGQAADDAGLAALERGSRAIDPAGFGDVDRSQRGALVSALRGIAKTPEDRAAAVAEVEKNARKLYGEAFKENVDVTPTLTRLAGRPSVQAAEKRAIGLANEVGMPFNARLEDMRPKSVYAGMRDLPESGFTIPDNPAPIYAGKRALPDSSVIDVSQKFDPLSMTRLPVETPRRIPSGSVDHYIDLPPGLKDISIPSGRTPTFVDIPPVESVPVRDMHTLKMGMDALLSDPTTGIAGREAAAVKATRNKLLDQLPESYQAARRSHIEMNKPVNQMDIGQVLHDRFVPALADGKGIPFKTSADGFALALRNGDKIAKNVTGLKNATLEGIMDPAQMSTLRGVVDDAAMIGAGQTAGRGVGSDTVQKMAMSNLIDQSGLPSWIGGFAPLRPAGGWLKTAGDILYTKNDETMRHLLADVLKDPARAAEAMKAAGVPPSKYAEILRAATQAGAVGAATTNQ